MNNPLRTASLLALGLLAIVRLPAQTKVAFPEASPTSTLTQRVGVTDVSITYSRPGVKGRKIFGGLVPYGQVWRTGANAATKLTLGTAATLNGTAVPAGTYEVFTIPTESTWTVILQKDLSQWGAYSYDPKNDVVRFEAKPEAIRRPVESLVFNFVELKPASANLILSWDTVRVPITITTDVVGLLVPRIQAAMAGTGKKPYFQAAQFYYDYDLDMKQAIAWIDLFLKDDPKNYFAMYHKATFLAKAGDKAGAVALAQQSLELAKGDKEPERGEYVRLNQSLIDSLK